MMKLLGRLFLLLAFTLFLTSCEKLKEYEVVFLGPNGEIIHTQKVGQGLPANPPDAPKVEGYTFTGWSVNYDNITSNLMIVAQYDINKYTVKFIVDGNVINTQLVEHGAEPVLPINPEKEGHIFTGWEDYSKNITSSCDFNATFIPENYNVVYYFKDGNIVSSQMVNYGSMPEAVNKDDMMLPGYNFLGWDKELTNVTSNIEVRPIYETINYDINYNLDEGVINDERNPLTYNIESGLIPLYPAIKEGHEFIGWYNSNNQLVENIVSSNLSDVTLTPRFKIKTYLLSFVDYQGSTFFVLEADHGRSIIAPDAPRREGYTFIGWDQELDNITSDLIVNAQYKINEYNVKFIVDGLILETQTVKHNNYPVKPENPVKEGHTFKDWDGYGLITKNTEITARFEINKYEVIFKNGAGDILLATTVQHGGIVTPPVNVEVAGYEFKKWDKDYKNISSDTIITGLYEIINYNIAYVLATDENNSSNNPLTYTIEDEVIDLIPATKEGYNFIGWYDELDEKVTKIDPDQLRDITLTPKFIIKQYDVKFYNYNEILLKSEKVNHGSMATAPTNPTRTGYTFKGWDQEFISVKSDLIITAIYQVNQYQITYQIVGLDDVIKSYDFDSVVTLPETLFKEGHSISWNEEIPTKMPAEDLIISGFYQINTYTITYKVQGKEDIVESYIFGAEIAIRDNLLKDEYNFVWNPEVLPATMPGEDLVVIGTFTPIPYDIVYHLNGGQNHSNNPSSYTIETPIIILGDAHKEGHKFDGWFDEMDNLVTEIHFDSSKSVVLTAKFTIFTYQVTFNDYDGTQIGSVQTINHGSPAVAPSNPVREFHTFTGWDKEFNEVTSDLIIVATYKINSYTITYQISGLNDEVETYDYGSQITIRPNLVKEGYTFAWNPTSLPETMPAENLVVVGTFTIISYKVTFKDYDGRQLGAVQTINKGFSAIAPTNPKRTGYTFIGWDKPFNQVTSDIVVTATYKINSYTITYRVSGLDDEVETYEYGSQITIRPNLVKEGHIFAWNPTSLPEIMPANDIIVIGNFTIRTYQVIFNDYDGTQIGTVQTINYGSSASAPADPERTGYQFTGWDKSFNTVTFSLVVTATYKINSYTITYRVSGLDDEVETYEYGSQITIRPNLVKEGYTFAWNPTSLPEIMPANDIIVIGNFTIKKYQVIFKDYNGRQIGLVQFIKHGSSATAPANPNRTGYTFTGWDKSFDVIKSNLEVIAQYTINSYTITYQVDGYDDEVVTYLYDDEVEIKPNLFKEGHYFEWTPEIPERMPAENLVIVGIFTLRTYKVTFKDYDGTQIGMIQTVEKGHAATAPADPTRTGYKFIGWDQPFDNVNTHLVITATYEINSYTITYRVSGVDDEVETYEYRTSITIRPNLVKEGYTFAWNPTSLPETMPAENLVVVGTFTLKTYRVVFKDYDGTQIGELQVVEHGSGATAPVAPERTGYNFSGWDKPFNNVTSYLTINATYTPKKYTITYQVDGLEDKIINYDFDAVVTPPEIPNKVGHSFAWIDTIPEIMPAENLTITGSYTLNTYTITYQVEGYGDEIEEYVFGAAITIRENLLKEGYTFAWNPAILPATMPAEDLVVIGTFTVIEYGITYLLDNGENHPNNPNKYTINTPTINLRSAYKEGHSFDGWIDNLGNPVIKINNGSTGEVVLTATYTIFTYQVTFKDYDGTQIGEVQTIDYGSGAIAPATPEREGYTFVNWSKAFDNVKSDLEIIAVYAVNKHTISFDSLDGDPVNPVTYNEGTTIALPTIQKQGNVFIGWSDGEHTYQGLYLITKTITLTAVWVELVNYTITFDVSGGIAIDPIEVETYSNVSELPIPEKDNYAFDGWLYLGNKVQLPFVYGFEDNITLVASWKELSVDVEYIIDNNEVIITGYSGLEEHLIIPDKIEGYPVTEVRYNAFKNNNTLRTLKFGKYLNTIGHEALSNMANLESVEFNNLTQTFGYAVLKGSNKLETITISSEIHYSLAYYFGDDAYIPASLKTIKYALGGTYINATLSQNNMNEATLVLASDTTTISNDQFFIAGGLTSLIIPSSVTKISSGAFYSCPNLETLYIPKTVETIETNAFNRCENLIIYTEINEKPSGWNDGWSDLSRVVWGYLEEVEEDSIRYALLSNGTAEVLGRVKNATNTIINIPSEVNGYSVAIILEEAFYASDITEVTIPKTLKLIERRAFMGCQSLTSVIFENDSQLESIGNEAFSTCTSLETIFIPESVTNIGLLAFANCYELIIYTPLYSKPEGWDSRWHGYRPFVYGNMEIVEVNGTEYVLPGNDTAYVLRHSGGKNVIILNQINGYPVTEIAASAFARGYIESVIIPNTVKTIGYFSFFNCRYLRTVVFEENSQVEEIQLSAFSGCLELEKILIPSSVKNIGLWAFSDCQNLASVKFEADSQLETIGISAFSDNPSLKTIIIPASVLEIKQGAFTHCSRLTIITSNASKPTSWHESWNPNNQPVMWGYTEIVIKDSIEYVLFSDGKAYVLGFADEIISTDVVIPSTIGSHSVYKIMENAFLDSQVTSIILPDSLEIIGTSAFEQCINLYSVVIPESVLEMGANVFYRCTNITIYTNLLSQPEGWEESWNGNRIVIWGGVEILEEGSLRYLLHNNGTATLLGLVPGSEITDLVIPDEVNGYIIETIEKYAFDSAPIQSVFIPNTIKVIKEGSFNNCYNLESVIFQENSQLESIENYAFCQNYKLSVITMPSSVVNVGHHIFTDFDNFIIFSELETRPEMWPEEWNLLLGYVGCDESETLKYALFSNNTAYIKGLSSSFEGSKLLIPSQVNGYVIKGILPKAFENNNLTSVRFEKESQLEIIGGKAFNRCFFLEEIIIPATVTTIIHSAFWRCNELLIFTELTEKPETWSENWNWYRPVNWGYAGEVVYENIRYALIGGKAVVMGLVDGSTATEIHLLNEVDGYTVDSINEFAFKDSTIESIVIPNTVKTIGKQAFSNCYYLASLTFEENSKLELIRDTAFSYCYNLKEIVIPNSVTHIEPSVFWFCYNLIIYVKMLERPAGWDEFFNNDSLVIWGYERNVESNGIKYVLRSNGTATIIGITENNTNSELDIPSHIDNCVVDTISKKAFSYCFQLISINIPSTIKFIQSRAFESCLNLVNVNIEANSKLETIGALAFSYNNRLESITLPNTITSMGDNVFENCNTLIIYVDFFEKPESWPENWNGERPVVWAGMEIIEYNDVCYLLLPGGYASVIGLVEGTSLVDVVIESEISGHIVNKIGTRAFVTSSNICTVFIPNTIKEIGSEAFKFDYNLIEVTFESGSQLEKIGREAFSYCSRLENINVPNTVITIEEEAFYYCSSLILYIDLNGKPDTWDEKWVYETPVVWANMEIVEIDGIEYLLAPNNTASILSANIQSVIDLVIPNEVDGYIVIKIESRAFKETKIKSVTIPNTIKIIGESAFRSCSNLLNVIFEENSQVETISNEAFSCCTSLQRIKIPTSVINLGYNIFMGSYTTIFTDVMQKPETWNSSWNNGRPVFWGDQKAVDYNNVIYLLTNDGYASVFGLINQDVDEVVIASEVNGNTVNMIRSKAFINISSIENVIIPNTIKIIGESAFDYCYNLAKITIESGSELETINNRAFYNCYKLTDISIPDSIIHIGNEVFYGCDKITIYMGLTNKPETWSDDWHNGKTVFWAGMSIFEAGGVKYLLLDDSAAAVVGLSNNYLEIGTDIVILGEVEGRIVISINENAFRFSAITSVIIPNTIEIIEEGAFVGCQSLTMINFESDSRLHTIGDSAFGGCYRLTRFIMPVSVVNIGFNVFSNNNSLIIYVSLTEKLETWPTNWNSERPVFFGIADVVEVNNVIYMLYIDGRAAVIGGNKNSGPYTIVSEVNGYIVDRIFDSAFKHNLSVGANIIIPNTIKTIGDEAFYMTNIHKVLFEEGSQLETIGTKAFVGCHFLREIVIPDSVTTIGSLAFSECSYLKSMSIPETIVNMGSNVFEGSNNINIYTKLEAKPETWAADWIDYDKRVMWGYDGVFESGLLKYARLTNGTVLVIGASAEYHNLIWPTHLTIPSNVDGYPVVGIGTRGLSGMKVISLTFETGPQFEIINNYAFEGFETTRIEIPSSVKFIAPFGFASSNVAEITFAEESQLEIIGNYAFMGTTALFVQIPEGVTYIGSEIVSGDTMLYTTLSSKPEGWEDNWNGNRPVIWEVFGFTLKDKILYGLTINGDATVLGFFPGNLTYDVVIPNVVEYGFKVTTIATSAFAGAYIFNIFIPSNVKIIDDYAFENCAVLENVIFDENSQLQSIGKSAFESCINLEKITIPATVTSIDVDVFKNSNKLTIYTDLTAKNEGWVENWNCNRPVAWGDWIKVEIDGVHYALSDNNTYTVFTVDVDLTITDVVIKSEIDGYPVTSIESYAFSNSQITSIIISNSVTTIGDWAFAECENLRTIFIPDSVINMGSNPFYNTIAGIVTEHLSAPTGWNEYWNSDNYIVWDSNEIVIINSLAYAKSSDTNYKVLRLVDDLASDIVIESEINGYSVDAIGKKAFYKSNIKSVVIPDSIENIGDKAFYENKLLKNVTIGKNSQLKGIHNFAFRHCKNLEFIRIPAGFNSLGNYTFEDCTKLIIYTELSSLPNNVQMLLRYDVKIMYECKEIIEYKNINYAIFNDNKGHVLGLFENDGHDVVIEPLVEGYPIVSILANAFANQNLSSIYIPSGIETINSRAFAGNQKLRTIVIPTSVTTMGEEVFESCDSLSIYTEYESKPALWDPTWIGSAIVSWGILGTVIEGSVLYVINGDGTVTVQQYLPSEITDVVILSSVNGYTVNKIGAHVFKESVITSIFIPNTITTIADGAFNKALELKEVTFEENSQLTHIGTNAFVECSNLRLLVIPSSVTTINNQAIGNNIFLTVLTDKLERPSGWDEAWANEIYVIWGCHEIVEYDSVRYALLSDDTAYALGVVNGFVIYDVNIQSSINDHIVTTIVAGAFMELELESINIPATITDIHSTAFGYNLTIIYFTEHTSLPVGWIGTFWETRPVIWDSQGMVEHESVRYGLSGDGTAYVIGLVPNSGATDITILSVVDGYPVKTIISRAFYKDEILQKVTIPISITSINSDAFAYCLNLKQVMFEELSQLETIGPGAFMSCKELLTIEIPAAVKIIDYLAFYLCYKLKIVTFEEESQLETIGDGAFSNCRSLTEIRLPIGVKSIDSHSFTRCHSLENVIIPSTVTFIGWWAFYETYNAKIFVDVVTQPKAWDIIWESGAKVYWRGQWYYDEHGNPTPNN